MSELNVQEKPEEVYPLKKQKQTALQSSKACISCGTSTVKNPKKNWHKGPTCSSCFKKAKYKANPEPDKLRRQNTYKANLIEERDKRQQYYATNKEEIKKQRHKSYLKNKETILAKQKKYRETHRVEASTYVTQRRKTDINFRLSGNLRNRLRRAIQSNFKKGSAVSDLGISIDDFKKYLESKFTEGMTWDNYGKNGWNIDHIIPLSSFDLTDHEQVKKACHYTNLQPMWAIDNLRKYNK